MKKSILIIAIMALVLASCSKQERTERKLVKAMLSEDYETSFAAMNEFCDWLKSDKSTMTHDFNYAQEKIGLKVNTSSDGQLRTYSWVTSQSESNANYANVMQWISGESMVGYSGPIDAMLTGRQPIVKRQWSLAHRIDTVYDIQEATQPIYMFVESYTNENGLSFTYITAAINKGLKIEVLPFFFDGIETAGNREYIDDGNVQVSDLIKYDDKAKKLYAYVTNESHHVIPGQYEVYALTPTRFVKVDKAAETAPSTQEKSSNEK